MQKVMDFDSALEVAERCRKGRITAGIYFDAPYSQVQLIDAMLAIVDHTALTEGHTHDELVKSRRQYAALNARYTKFAKKHGVDILQEKDSE